MITRIPQYLDEPERYFIFTPDELVVVVLPLVVLTIVANFLVGLIAGAVMFMALRKLKKGGNLNRILWVGYWLLPTDMMGLKKTPPSFARMWVA